MSDNQANMPLPSSMATDLAELKDIEKVITSQLTELGQKIDNSFSKAAEFVNDVTEVASSFANSVKIPIILYFLVQLYEIKVIDAAACFLVVEGIEAHICFLQLLCTIIEWGGGMLLCSHCHYHVGSEDCAVGAFNTLRLYLKYLTHVLFI